jgi:RimJ/RimL family protein N-acetyltransferase
MNASALGNSAADQVPPWLAGPVRHHLDVTVVDARTGDLGPAQELALTEETGPEQAVRAQERAAEEDFPAGLELAPHGRQLVVRDEGAVDDATRRHRAATPPRANRRSGGAGHVGEPANVARRMEPGSGQNGSVSDDEDTGRPVLRGAGPDDAVALMKLKQRLDEETSFMLLEPNERDSSIPTLARHLEEVSRSENSVVIVADRHGELAGYVELAGGTFRRNRSTTHVIIGVLAEASGQGVGSSLLAEAKRWAAARGLHRMELTVMAHNHRAIALYERMGFVHEGRRVGCLLIDGVFLDELYMAMILPASTPVSTGAV